MRAASMLLLAALLCVTVTQASQCPSHCECGSGALLSWECGSVTVRARDDLYMEVDCMDNVWNCSVIPRVPMFRGDKLHRLEISNCRPSDHTEDVSYKCALEALGARDTEALAMVGARGDLTPAHVEGMKDVKALYVAAAPDAAINIPTSSINSLPLRSVRLLSLPPQPLPPLLSPSLQRLEVAMTGLRSLPARAFVGLGQLQVLSLWKDGIVEVNVDAFQGLQSLEELVLNNNPLPSLPAGVFTDPTRLKKLCMERVKLEALDHGVISGLQYLEQLKISSDVPLKLSPLSLSNLPSLSSLHLSRSHISHLPPTLLDNTTSIVNMSLDNNNISLLPERLFSRLSLLQRLDLSANEIEVVSRSIFQNMRALIEVKLDRNKIQVLPERVFSGLPRLRVVSARHNWLHSIPLSSLSGAQSLSTLSLDYNRLSWGEEVGDGEQFLVEPSSPFNMLTSLKTLSLRGNNISVVFSDWRFVLLQLEHLDLSYNGFTALTESDLQFLQTSIKVDFSHNNITSVFPYIRVSDESDQSDVDRFILNDNPFDCSCSLYHFLAQGRQTNMYDISNAKCLTPNNMNNVTLKSVNITEITCPLDDVTNCNCVIRPAKMRVECDCTKLTNLPNPAEIGLDSMALRLQSVNLNLKLPDFVTELNISNLNLKAVPKIPKTVKFLDVSNNKLEKIPTELLNVNLTLKLSRNPLTCDCWTSDDVILLKKYSKHILDYHEVICSNRKLNILDPSTLCNVYQSAVTGSLVAFTGLLIGVLLAVTYRYKVEIQVYLYSKRICLFLLPKEVEDTNKMYDVFVSFAPEDEKFVCQEILPNLEGRYVLHVQDRDWEVGDTIPTQIRQSIELSCRTLIILTDNFLKSIWSTEELRTIHGQAAKDKRTRAVIITKLNKVLDKDTKTYLSLATKVKWGEKMFWEKLIYALPRKDMYVNNLGGNSVGGKGNNVGGKGNNFGRNCVVNGFDDVWKGDCLNVMLNEEGKLVNKGYVIKE